VDTTNSSTLWKAGGPGFSSASDNWATPRPVFAALNDEFAFELDACASAANSTCRRFYSVEDDGLAQEWAGVVWVNPPYGRGIGAWLKKAADSAAAGATVVCLIPARTDTTWWHDQVLARAAEVRFVRGRLSFGNGSAPAPFPSAIVVFRPERRPLIVSAWARPEGAR
jgi:phage N-6-adenine-methyltransferase